MLFYFQRKNQSGFFFIDNTFYNDMRNPANEDYSKWLLFILWYSCDPWWLPGPLQSGHQPQSDARILHVLIDLNQLTWQQHILISWSSDWVTLISTVTKALVNISLCLQMLRKLHVTCHINILYHSMLHPDDCQDANLYPLLVFQARARRRVCGICAIYTATWVSSTLIHSTHISSIC